MIEYIWHEPGYWDLSPSLKRITKRIQQKQAQPPRQHKGFFKANHCAFMRRKHF